MSSSSANSCKKIKNFTDVGEIRELLGKIMEYHSVDINLTDLISEMSALREMYEEDIIYNKYSDIGSPYSKYNSIFTFLAYQRKIKTLYTDFFNKTTGSWAVFSKQLKQDPDFCYEGKSLTKNLKNQGKLYKVYDTLKYFECFDQMKEMYKAKLGIKNTIENDASNFEGVLFDLNTKYTTQSMTRAFLIDSAVSSKPRGINDLQQFVYQLKDVLSDLESSEISGTISETINGKQYTFNVETIKDVLTKSIAIFNSYISKSKTTTTINGYLYNESGKSTSGSLKEKIEDFLAFYRTKTENYIYNLMASKERYFAPMDGEIRKYINAINAIKKSQAGGKRKTRSAKSKSAAKKPSRKSGGSKKTSTAKKDTKKKPSRKSH